MRNACNITRTQYFNAINGSFDYAADPDDLIHEMSRLRCEVNRLTTVLVCVQATVIIGALWVVL